MPIRRPSCRCWRCCSTPSSRSCRRRVAARDFFLGALTADLADDDIVTRITFSKLPPKTGWGFEEVARRGGDFALAAVAATLTVADGAITQARVAMMGLGDRPKRAAEVEALLLGRALEPELIDAATSAARAGVEPHSDLHASSDYRRHLIGVLTARTLTAAWRRAHGTHP